MFEKYPKFYCAKLWSNSIFGEQTSSIDTQTNNLQIDDPMIHIHLDREHI